MKYEKHGMSETRTYAIWLGMKQRCGGINGKGHPEYSGKGVYVCDRWKNSFENFLEDMGECPDGFSLDRKDGGNYSPQECRWADRSTQTANCKKKKSGTGIRNVQFRKDLNQYSVTLTKNGIKYYVGCTPDIEVAELNMIEKYIELWDELPQEYRGMPSQKLLNRLGV